MYKLSIIIPVYNVKNYLNQCLESIVSQNEHEQCEIVIVDDGSTDGSSDICDEYYKKYSNFKVIHKKNEGPAIARNIGIKESNGEYIMFLDSDDMLIEGSIRNVQELIKQKKNVDVFLGQMFKIIYPRGSVKNRIHLISFNDYDRNILKNILRHSTISITYIWRNIYSSKLIKQNNIYFQEGILCSEDLDWNTNIYLKAKKVDVIDFYTHIYRGNRKGSIVTACSFNKTYDFFKIVNKWLDIANEIDDEELSRLIKNFYANGFYANLKYIFNYNKKQRNIFIKEIDVSTFWEYSSISKNKKIFKLKKIIGLKNILLILNISYRVIYTMKRIAIGLKLIDR